MLNRRIFLAAALAATLAARETGAEILHLKSPSTLETERGSRLSLPPGYFLDEEEWRDRDFEMQRLQELETRLTAENQSLRESAADPRWWAVGTAGVVGVALGVVVYWVATK